MPDRLHFPRGRKGWRKPEGAVMITRASVFGNPWRQDAILWPDPTHASRYIAECMLVDECHLALDEVIDQYRAWIEGYALTHVPPRLTRAGRRAFWDACATRRAHIWERLPELRGRDLVCTCAPGAPCHGDVLLEIANA